MSNFKVPEIESLPHYILAIHNHKYLMFGELASRHVVFNGLFLCFSACVVLSASYLIF